MGEQMWEHLLGAVPGDHWDSSIPQDESNTQQMSYQEMININKQLIAEVAKGKVSLNTLERENEYLMALLHDIQSGLNALNYHITTADNSNDGPEIWSQFERAFTAIKLTNSALSDAIEEWESKWVLPMNEIPF